MSFALFTFPPFCRFLASWPLGQSCLAGCGRAEDRRLERATLEADCRGARDVSARTLARTPNSDCEVQMLKLAVGFNELTPGAPRVGASRSEESLSGSGWAICGTQTSRSTSRPSRRSSPGLKVRWASSSSSQRRKSMREFPVKPADPRGQVREKWSNYECSS